MTGLLSDCRHALRLYARTPFASFIAVAVLAIAMGIVTLFLSLYVGLVLQSHPGFERPRALVTFGPGDASNIGTLPKDLIDRIATDVSSLETAAGIGTTQLQVDGEGSSRLVELVTPEFFPGLRPKLAIGRGFAAADYAAEAEPVAVISYAYWQDRFGGSADVLGTTLALAQSSGAATRGPGAPTSAGERAATANAADDEDAEDFEVRIVGVMSRDYGGFSPAQFMGGVAMWLPDEHGFALLPSSPGVDGRTSLRFAGVGRRSAGASPSAVATELTGRYGGAVGEFGAVSASFHAVAGVVPSLSLQRELLRVLQMFLAASVLLALVAAANVTLFLLARAPGRRRELAIRLSVGAPLKRLARQLVTEAAVFLSIAGAFALALALWLAGLLRTPLRSIADTSIDWRVLVLLAACLALLTALVSLSPVLGLRQLGIGGGSRQVTARATLAQQIAGTVQIAVAGALSAAGLAFAWQVGVLLYGDPGYATENLHYARFAQLRFTSPNGTRVAAPVALASGFIDAERRHAAIAALPGVEAVSISGAVPGAQTFSMTLVPSPTDPAERVQVRVTPIDSRFTAMLGLRVIDGRTPAPGEPGVALVNRTLAQTLFGRDDVTGESLPLMSTGQTSTEIVGVIEDLSFGHPSAEVPPMAFVTSISGTPASFGALIESGSTSAQLMRQLRDLADSGAIELPAVSVQPLTTLRTNALAGDIARAALTMFGALLVVVLAVAGFYGTQRYLVTAGRREYAIRASLGAGPAALGRLVIGRGLRLGVPGIVVGTLIAIATVAWLRDNYIPRQTSALAIALVVAAALVLMLLAASFAPARRARRTQPAPLLRDD